MRKFLPVFVVITIVLIVILVATRNSGPDALASYTPIRYGDEVPDGLDKVDIDSDSMVLLVDATKDQRFADLPTQAYIGDKITVRSKDYFFAVTPTEKGKHQELEVHSPGDRVEVVKNDFYTILVFRKMPNNELDPQPVGRAYIIKADEKGLTQMMKFLNERMREGAEPEEVKT